MECFTTYQFWLMTFVCAMGALGMVVPAQPIMLACVFAIGSTKMHLNGEGGTVGPLLTAWSLLCIRYPMLSGAWFLLALCVLPPIYENLCVTGN